MNVSSRAMLPVVVLMGICAAPAIADSIYGTPRQYYSGYTYVPSCDYGYRTYYFKPTPDYAGYDYHYVIYPNQDPNNAYYYNPHSQSFWGRCPSHCHGEPLYSFLRPLHRQSSLGDIPQSAFPQPGPLPAIPGATDNTTLDLAPDDTPVTPSPAAAAIGAPPVGTPVVGTPPGVAGAAPPIGGPPPGVPTAAAPPADAPPAAAAIPAIAAGTPIPQ